MSGAPSSDVPSLRSVGKRSILAAALFGALSLAPTVGDIGGCGTEPEELSSARYGRARKNLECERCRECSLGSNRCRRACDAKKEPEVVLPQTCRPLVHDGTVCLRALLALSCDEFAGAVDDRAPRTPGECLFCVETSDAGAVSFVNDASASGRD